MKKKNYIRLSINKELFDIEINEDDIIECFPSRVLGNTIGYSKSRFIYSSIK